MKWEMEVLSPESYLSTANWLVEEGKNTRWTAAENKMFENALAVYDKDTPDKWHKVAAMIPGKTAEDVLMQYRELEADVSSIEAGLIPIPGYSTSTSPFTLEWVSSHGYDGFRQQAYGLAGKRSSSIRPPDQERKKGVPWTEEEHKLFLMGLKKYGKGDWRNISRNFVITRTPTQVASHAQKYFIRQLSGGKDKRRASIHDITTVNLYETRTPSPDSKGPSPEEEAAVLFQQAKSDSTPRTHYQWIHQQSKGTISSNSAQGNMFTTSYGLKMQGRDLQRSSVHESSFIGPQNLVFKMQSSQRYPHG
ncbi:DIV1A protein [Tripterygium wilfordii]|uniref:DIV1A protein n=1 Tax=Tripterygium wilfordii TaxID=458696 RepID=A0A7J7DYE6_TRIWF|nr:transcription factor DIVARICATA [Tripterygium wilfordii]KAF5751395.1 DIV1A protein [Tripterygium wilfordii]